MSGAYQNIIKTSPNPLYLTKDLIQFLLNGDFLSCIFIFICIIIKNNDGRKPRTPGIYIMYVIYILSYVQSNRYVIFVGCGSVCYTLMELKVH